MVVLRITYDLLRHDYDDFVHRFREILANHDGPEGEEVLGHPVLPQQRNSSKPARWLHIRLEGNNNESTTLAVRDDNVYLIGFMNQNGQWYEFGYSGTNHCEKSRRMLGPPDQDGESIFLECGSSYGCIVYGGASCLVNVALGDFHMKQAVSYLSAYRQPAGGRANEKIKRALARLIVMICEAARMQPPLETVRQSWTRRGGVCIPREQVDYFWNWGDISEALLRWKKAGYSNDYALPCHLMKIEGILGPATAHNIVRLLLNRPVHGAPRWSQDRFLLAAAGGNGRRLPAHQQDSKRRRTTERDQGRGSLQQPAPNQGRHGRSHSEREATPAPPEADDNNYVVHARPLVEIFAVRAVSFHFVGTVAVFDGRRGQVIYKNNVPIHDSPTPGDYGEPLPLTGPYTAISAYGSFTVEVEITGSGAKDAGELNWDCYNEENAYDQHITSSIITNRSSREVTVTYAVLSEAVEAKVEVQLLLPGASTENRVIYGQIATRSQAFNGDDLAWSVLFDSMREGVRIAQKGSDSMAQLPLARSVIAMPLGWPLIVKASLYDAPPSQEGVNPFFQRQDLELTLRDRTKKIPTDNGGEIEVKITSPDLRRLEETSYTMMTTISQGCTQPSC